MTFYANFTHYLVDECAHVLDSPRQAAFNTAVSERQYPLPTPTMLLRAYAMGIFPMAESATSGAIHWYDPPIRALIPLDNRFHVPRRLVRTLRKAPYRVTLNQAFQDVVHGCAEPRKGRETTWINNDILRLYTSLRYRGHAHSIEVWEGTELVGGLYGVAMGSAFFGESMFSRKSDASKIALVHLVGLLRAHKFKMLDTQFQTDHLQRFGTFEVTRPDYLQILEHTVRAQVRPFPFYPNWAQLVTDVLNINNQ